MGSWSAVKLRSIGILSPTSVAEDTTASEIESANSTLEENDVAVESEMSMDVSAPIETGLWTPDAERIQVAQLGDVAHVISIPNQTLHATPRLQQEDEPEQVPLPANIPQKHREIST